MESDGIEHEESHKKAKDAAEYWTKISSEGIAIFDVPQVGQQNMSYRDVNGEWGALPGMIRSVSAIDPEGSRFEIALFESPVACITATLADRSKRIRRPTTSSNPPGIHPYHPVDGGADYIGGT